MKDIDFREHVDMNSDIFRGKSSAEISRALNPEARQIIVMEVMLEVRLKIIEGKIDSLILMQTNPAEYTRQTGGPLA